MTVKQAFIYKTKSEVSDSEASLALSFVGLNPESDFQSLSSSEKCKFYTAVISHVSQDNVGVKSISEGGYSISYDLDLKKNFLKELADESGCSNLINKYSLKPIVKNKSYLW